MKKIILPLVCAVLALISCKKDSMVAPNQPAIHTAADSTVITFTLVDTAGPGQNDTMQWALYLNYGSYTGWSGKEKNGPSIYSYTVPTPADSIRSQIVCFWGKTTFTLYINDKQVTTVTGDDLTYSFTWK